MRVTLFKNNLVSDCDDESVVNNVIRCSSKPCASDCSTHVMIGDGCRVLPKNVFWAVTIIVSCGLANFERTSFSTQRCPKFLDRAMNRLQRQTTASSSKNSRTTTLECATVAQYGWSHAGSSTIPITTRRIHVGRNPRIMESILESRDYHELHSRLYEGISRFISAKNVMIILCESWCRRSVANAKLWSNTLTRYG